MWAQIINIVIGLGLMVAPSILKFNKVDADNNHIVGPLVITFAVISLWEINRNARWFNIVTGSWLLIAPFVLAFTFSAKIVDLIAGVLIIIFSFFSGKVKRKYGGGWRSLFQKHPLHMQAVKSSSFK